jgi:hypothetical protein
MTLQPLTAYVSRHDGRDWEYQLGIENQKGGEGTNPTPPQTAAWCMV